MLRSTRRSRSMRFHASSACAVEALESRVLLSTYMVMNHRDSGVGSFRDAVQQSNGDLGPDTITFAVTGTITLTSGQLEISNDLTITGPGAGLLTISGNNQSRVFQVDFGVTASISGITIADGHAADGGTSFNIGGVGGGIYNLGTLTLSDDVLVDNSGGNGGPGGAGGNGGAIYSSETLSVIDSTIDSNAGGNGGAGVYEGGTGLYVPGAGGSGGGIDAQAGRVVIVGSTISNNHGGGPGNMPAGYLVGGQGGSGGGIESGADLTLVNSTVAGNATGQSFGVGFTANGAGIDSRGALHITNSTISANSGVGLDIEYGPAVLNNTIVAGSIGDLSGGFDSSTSHNNLIGGDPKLGGLANNGGPTQTMLPLHGSPAIDAGSNALAVGPDGKPLITDQRGMPRIVDATGTGTPTVDIGAVEAPPTPPPPPPIVTSTADVLDHSYDPAHLSLRDAVAIVNSSKGPQTITFAAGLSGTISLSGSLGPLEITNTSGPITIQGPGAGALTVTQASGVVALQVDPGGNVAVSGLRVQGGYPTEISNNGTLALTDCILNSRSTASIAGGITNSGTLTLSGCTIGDPNGTGGISNSGILTFINSIVVGGGIDNSGKLTLSDVTMTNEGSLANESQGTLVIQNSVVYPVSPIENHGTATVSASSIGGVSNTGTLTVRNSMINGGSNTNGGGVSNAGMLTLSSCTISGNSAESGGGIYNAAGAVLTATGCTISDNTAKATSDNPVAVGGGVENLGSATFVNCTIADNIASPGTTNSANISGGGIYNSGALKLVNCTIGKNIARSGTTTAADAAGGGLYVAMGQPLLVNTLVAGNSAVASSGDSLPDDVEGAIDAASAYNLIGAGLLTTALTPANHNQVGTAAAPIDSKLGPLANNGGPTQTMALLSGSPAIDAGSNALALGPDGRPLLIDQRGYYRVFNSTVDVGAYEYNSAPLLPGDANGDGKTDFADLLIVARNYGMSNANWSQGDFDGDGKVDFGDFVILARNYGSSITQGAAGFAAFSVADTSVPSVPATDFGAGLPRRRVHGHRPAAHARLGDVPQRQAPPKLGEATPR